ncbi:MAG: anion transporter [Bdellovibrionaceae bacterium]|nr:anion transporter [Pseudobdellovibrionaceae bacterium]
MKTILCLIPPALLLPLLYFLGDLSPESFRTIFTLYLTGWMVLWWSVEFVPLGITALLPMVYLPTLGLSPIKAVAPTYSNPVIYLFLGGFIIARALEKTRLSERFALRILKSTADSQNGIVLGFIIATTFLSMWISNTATTVMMVPIAMSVIHFLEKRYSSKDVHSLALVLFLSIAYSANIGGTMTPVGTPPNVVMLGYLGDLYNMQIDFWRWLTISAPVAISLLLVMFVSMKALFPCRLRVDQEFIQFVKESHQSLGPVSYAQKRTLQVFTLTAFLWVFKGLIHKLTGVDFLNDTSIAIFGGLLLFCLPDSPAKKHRILDLDDVSYLPWDIVLLFGGGMALAAALKDAGLIELTTSAVTSSSDLSIYWIIFGLTAISLFLTEIMSNVALCVVAMPVIMEIGVSLGLSPFVAAYPAAICTSYAFSLPISTPPNAIVFATNRVRISEMLRIGIILNFVGLALVMTLGWYLVKWLGI